MTTETVLSGDDIDDAAERIYGTTATHQELQFARAIEKDVLQSPEVQALREDFNESMALLNTLFGLWECGPACYDRPGDGATYIGNAFRLDDETFRKCVDMLNRGRQNDAAKEKQS